MTAFGTGQIWQTVDAIPAPAGWRVVVSDAGEVSTHSVALWLRQRRANYDRTTLETVDIDELVEPRFVPGVAAPKPTADSDGMARAAGVDAAHHFGDVLAVLAPGEPVPAKYEEAGQ